LEDRMGRLDGKVAIVTGAGQGIGLGIALALASEGASISIAELEADRAQRAAEEVRARGVPACAVTCDVRERSQVDAAVALTVAELGGIDIVVNNAIATGHDAALAASGGQRPFMETTEDLMRLQWESGPLGTFHVMQACYPHLRGRETSIVNVASRAGTDGIAGYTAYAAAKEAIRALSRVASREWGRDGIRVNVICPHARTPAQQKFAEANPGIEEQLIAHIPLGRMGDAEQDIGGAVVMLSSSDARYVTGQTIMVNGGA
jgi:2-hydroxycyclohexanecarboxyl-CoA dehydrogenase